MQNRQQTKQQANKGRRFAAHLRRCTAAFQPALMPLMVASALAAIAVPAGAQESARIEFDIPAQALDSSLRTFAQRAQAQVLFDEATVAGLQAPALKGSYTAGEALSRLLAGTGITASASRGNQGGGYTP